jgi:hypothetical protein
MSGIFESSDFTAEGVVHALQLAGDELRLTTADAGSTQRRGGGSGESVGAISRWFNR